ncbi:phospho-acceptor domain-containing protein [Microbacterium sp. AG1240]|uniref:sensor histidine kinase n=1 Tax=Microbacterium sp. AG1240 TaxID=2183992 RepID=UPI000EB3F4C9|nr:PAS domain-containing sensor histidine kinase [Microbacterium sp. AG1240]RKT35990.1 phospho-acceptor domain-containing protein [Microbacterium sp. AG1240]
MGAAIRLPVSSPVDIVEDPDNASPSSRTRSIWLFQLVLAASVIVTVIVVQALQPQLFAAWTFAAGVMTIIVLTVATLVVPWQRVPRNAVVIMPFLDLIGIGLLAFDSDMRFGFFWVFPVTWIASYYSLLHLGGALGTVGAIILIDASLNGPTPFSALRLLVVMLSLTFIGLTTYLTARQNNAFKNLLRRQASRLQSTLQRVTGQERRVSEMLNGLDTGIARLSSDGEVLALNDTYVTLYAVDRDDPKRPGASVEYATLRGEPLPEPDRPFMRAARGEQFEDERVWLYDTHGQWHALSASTRRLTSSADEPATTLLIIHDVTALIEAERAREQIATVVSHELRNPLTAIIGHADLLLDHDDLPARVREQIEVIDNAGQRMQKLISEILAGSRARSDESSAQSSADVRRIIDASVQSFRPASDGRRIAIILDVPGHLPVVGDAFRLRQAFDNILSNAIKYTPGGGTVRISATKTDDRLVIAFADTGVGISPADLPRIFDPYFRTQSARESPTPGTGLGMGIVRDIVEQQGGTLDVDSEQGTGTTVTVSLPIETEA